MNTHKLYMAILLLFICAVFTTALLVSLIVADVYQIWQEMIAVLNISLFVTPLFFTGFLFRNGSMLVSDIYENIRSGFIAAAAFGFSSIIAALFWQDWLELLQRVIAWQAGG